MNYEETLAYLYAQLPMYQNQGDKAIKKDLTNIQELMKELGSPHKSYPSIHVAGTNGKGTTAHLLSAIFQSAGKKVGLYTSPHYVDFRERIKVDGKYITKEFVINFISRIKPSISKIRPSFFEITVAMAFSYFQSEQVSIAIIETGLGGRLDSTNIVDPILSVITNISLDHTNTLGPDEYNIAKEKAGIIKPYRPVVIGKFQSSCDQIFMKKARLQNSPISFASLNWKITVEDTSRYLFSNSKENKELVIDSEDSSPFAIENMTTSLEVIKAYNKYVENEIDDNSIVLGIQQFRSISNYKGRWQILARNPLIITDSAHNPGAIKTVLERLNEYNADKKHFVLGFVKGKDLLNILNLFDAKDLFYFTRPSVPRGLDLQDLITVASKANLRGDSYDTVHDAFEAAKKKASPEDLIFVGGSSFVVADILTNA